MKNVGWNQDAVEALAPGSTFMNIQSIAADRGWAGVSQTQFTGYPLAPGGTPLLTTLHPCTGVPLYSIDETTGALNNDGAGHVAFAAIEAQSSRAVPYVNETDPPTLCPDPCIFNARTMFYPISEPPRSQPDGRRPPPHAAFDPVADGSPGQPGSHPSHRCRSRRD